MDLHWLRLVLLPLLLSPLLLVQQLWLCQRVRIVIRRQVGIGALRFRWVGIGAWSLVVYAMVDTVGRSPVASGASGASVEVQQMGQGR